ncbi:MAG: ATP-dependent RecD-like DNA helicase [Proteobacteria bacterium]|nr:ATP-dependent RecD-like DNA helicase [Pseudomonadota bacterium]
MHIKQDKDFEYLSGIVERITYHNPENGFAVLRVKAKGHKELVTVTGVIASICVGEYVQAGGGWVRNRDHGMQFKANFLKALPPNNLEGIEKYLGSGLIKGVGPHFAKRLVKAFGEDVFDVIEQHPERLRTVEGVGKVRSDMIQHNWHEQKIVREIMIFLQSHGVGTARATRIFKTYGQKAIAIVSENPYRLAKDIRGIGFATADNIAKTLGIEKDSLIRVQSGINHTLFEAASQGHCCLPEDELIQQAQKILEVDESVIIEAIDNEIESGFIIEDSTNGKKAIFLANYYDCERNIAQKLIELSKGDTTWQNIDIDTAISWVEEKTNIELAHNQKLAVKQAVNCKVSVITGGPGTGKTTIVNSILTILRAKKLKIKVCAPTGRAAKRLSESTKLEAKTIHRLLEIDPKNGQFRYNELFPLDCDYLVIDESSMVDVNLFYSLIKAIPQKAALLIVGDVDQLPSVGAGQLLADIIDSRTIPVTILREIFRQAGTSNIIINAHKINQGYLPDFKNSVKDGDFYFVESQDSEEALDKLITMVKTRIPQKFGFNPINDIQILCPMQRGGLGVRAINAKLQEVLNPNYKNGVERFGEYFAVGDKVMQTENNYDKNVYNGDIGFIKKIDDVEQEVTINFDNIDVIYDYSDLDQINLAYATTIHKSQGCEYKAVIMPITMQSFMMLRRNLIYTGITRGKELVVIIGEKKATAMAVKNAKTLHRHSKLKEWLIQKSR